MSPDSALLQAQLCRTALGDHAAFKQVYDLSGGHLYAVALRVVRKAELADEILQEAFINVWHHAPQYNPATAGAMTWLINIVRNKALDLVRSAHSRHEASLPDDGLDALAAVADEAPHSLALLSAASDKLAISICLNQLDAAQRQSLALAYYQGLSHSEVASHLNAPLGSVKAWVRRGLARLKLCLEQAA